MGFASKQNFNLAVLRPDPAIPEGLRAAVHVDRSMPGRPSARAHRAANAKTTAQTLPLGEDAARPGSPTCPEAWSCVGAKVSAIRLKLKTLP